MLEEENRDEQPVIFCSLEMAERSLSTRLGIAKTRMSNELCSPSIPHPEAAY